MDLGVLDGRREIAWGCVPANFNEAADADLGIRMLGPDEYSGGFILEEGYRILRRVLCDDSCETYGRLALGLIGRERSYLGHIGEDHRSVILARRLSPSL